MIKELFWVFLAGTSPVLEVRVAIPLGIFVFKLNIFLVYIVAVVGNFIVVPLLLIFLRYFSEFLMHRFYFFNRLLSFVFSMTRARHSPKFEKLEYWALAVLVAIPLPLTGAWTASLCAFLFDIPFKKSLWLIGAGIMVAGLIVVALSLLGKGIFLG
ncbi:small multi-drug export protein [Patescibacteria group bacterium]|nr:small multi-drug export protein [Patescibacteria group bacterium]